MKQCLIIILLLLSACSPKNVNLPNVSQEDTKSQTQDTKFQTLGTRFQGLKEILTKLYAVSSKGEVTINAQKGNAYMKWDDHGVTIFFSRDFVANPSEPWADKLNKSIMKFAQGIYSRSEGKVFIERTEAYLQWDDSGITFVIPKTVIERGVS